MLNVFFEKPCYDSVSIKNEGGAPHADYPLHAAVHDRAGRRRLCDPLSRTRRTRPGGPSKKDVMKGLVFEMITAAYTFLSVVMLSAAACASRR